jgi:hypothetical protein
MTAEEATEQNNRFNNLKDICERKILRDKMI